MFRNVYIYIYTYLVSSETRLILLGPMSWRCADKQSTLGLHWFCTKGRGLRLHHIAQGFHHPHADVACHNILGECDLWLQLLFHARKMSESHLGVLRCSTDLV